MSLRYTNPSGAHPSGYIGEVRHAHLACRGASLIPPPVAQDPTNAANLMPIVTHVLQGKREHVKVRLGTTALVFAVTDAPRRVRSTVPTTTRPTARACATSFTWWISPKLIWRLSDT